MSGILSKNRYGLAVAAAICGILVMSAPALAQNSGGLGGLGHAVGGLGNAVGGLGNTVGGTVGAVGGALGGANVGVNANVGSVTANSDTSLNANGLNSNTTVIVPKLATANVKASATRAKGVNARITAITPVVNAKATASLNGATGVNANIRAGTPVAVANVAASVNGATGVNANIGVNVPPATSTSGNPGSSGTGVNVGTVSAELSTMSRAERISLKNRCALIVGASESYDADLVKLCRMLAKL
ncbi:hypothetical protein [Labrys miyagiensis]|nr:hypothetical protein [Labrys miyagiensis]